MGITLNTQDNCTHSYIEDAKEILRIVGVRFFSFFFRHESLFLMFSRQKNEYLKYAQDLQKFTNDVIKARLETYKQEKDKSSDKNELGVRKQTTLMDILLNELESGKIDYEGVREEIDTFMVAVSVRHPYLNFFLVTNNFFVSSFHSVTLCIRFYSEFPYLQIRKQLLFQLFIYEFIPSKGSLNQRPFFKILETGNRTF